MEWGRVFENIGIFMLRFLAVLLLFTVALFVGGMIGYSLLGQGHPNPLDIFEPQMWQDLLSFVLG